MNVKKTLPIGLPNVYDNLIRLQGSTQTTVISRNQRLDYENFTLGLTIETTCLNKECQTFQKRIFFPLFYGVYQYR